jgi:hypothetical protein
LRAFIQENANMTRRHGVAHVGQHDDVEVVISIHIDEDKLLAPHVVAFAEGCTIRRAVVQQDRDSDSGAANGYVSEPIAVEIACRRKSRRVDAVTRNRRIAGGIYRERTVAISQPNAVLVRNPRLDVTDINPAIVVEVGGCAEERDDSQPRTSGQASSAVVRQQVCSSQNIGAPITGKIFHQEHRGIRNSRAKRPAESSTPTVLQHHHAAEESVHHGEVEVTITVEVRRLYLGGKVPAHIVGHGALKLRRSLREAQQQHERKRGDESEANLRVHKGVFE